MAPDKMAAFERNIAAAQEAMQQASARGDADAYDRALYVLRWATRSRDGQSLMNPEDHRETPREGLRA